MKHDNKALDFNADHCNKRGFHSGTLKDVDMCESCGEFSFPRPAFLKMVKKGFPWDTVHCKVPSLNCRIMFFQTKKCA